MTLFKATTQFIYYLEASDEYEALELLTPQYDKEKDDPAFEIERVPAQEATNLPACVRRRIIKPETICVGIDHAAGADETVVQVIRIIENTPTKKA